MNRFNWFSSQDQNNDLLSYCSPVFLIDMHGTLWGPQESRAQGWDHGTGHSEAISSEEGRWERFPLNSAISSISSEGKHLRSLAAKMSYFHPSLQCQMNRTPSGVETLTALLCFAV